MSFSYFSQSQAWIDICFNKVRPKDLLLDGLFFFMHVKSILLPSPILQFFLFFLLGGWGWRACWYLSRKGVNK